MNKVILIGRLARDPEVRYTQAAEPMAICRFAVAVDRPYQRNRGENDKTVDFLNCICFGARGGNINKFFKKGNRIAITGRIQTGEYTDKQGIKRYTTDIVVEDFEFAESKNSSSNAGNKSDSILAPPKGFYTVDDGAYDEDLPF